MPIGTLEVRADDEHPAEVADGGGPLRRRADHEPRRVAQHQHRQRERVAQLHEPGSLVRAVGVDRAAEVGRVVRDHAERPAVDARERGHHPEAEAAPQLEHVVEQRIDHRADVVDALAVQRDQVAQRGVVGSRRPARLAPRPRKYDR